MSYKINKTMLDDAMAIKQNKIEDILTDDEQIIWEQTPKKSAYIWNRILTLLPFVLIWLVIDGAFIAGLIISGVLAQFPTFITIALVLFFMMHLLPLWIWIAGIIHGIAEYKNIKYVITTRRLIVRSGIIPDFSSFEYTSLTDVKCRVGLVDRILKVGDLYIQTKGQPVVLYDIANPYQISNLIQKVIIDIKSDILYPNSKRAVDNKGYHTTYDPKD